MQSVPSFQDLGGISPKRKQTRGSLGIEYEMKLPNNDQVKKNNPKKNNINDELSYTKCTYLLWICCSIFFICSCIFIVLYMCELKSQTIPLC